MGEQQIVGEQPVVDRKSESVELAKKSRREIGAGSSRQNGRWEAAWAVADRRARSYRGASRHRAGYHTIRR